MDAARINARLDPELARKLEAVQQATGQTTTEVLRAAIARAYEEHVRDEGANVVRDAFARTGFVGCAEGPADLAEGAKRYLTEGLAAKSGAPRRRKKK
jgi:predicted transcriptional regulator